MFVLIRIRRMTAALLAAAVLICCGCAGTAAAVAQAQRKGTPLPVMMYHSILPEGKIGGRYVVSPQTLESDFAWLNRNGFHTVAVRDLLDYVDGTSGETRDADVRRRLL